MEYQLELQNVAKHYDDFVAVDDVSLQIRKGEIISLLGASGCGKTTTLRMIAGLITPTHGKIYIQGRDMEGVPPYQRDLSMVFQNYALFPHMNVFENIVYGLRMRKIKDKRILQEKARNMMEIVQLHGVENRLPRELSGGQQQRVSLARAMIVEPKVMLFDEPLSNLDAKLREQTRVEIRNLLKEMNVTAIYVTHDQEEALTISDRIAVMHRGRIEQITEPRKLYTNPKTRYIADFVGHANFFSGAVTDISGGTVTVRTESGHDIHVSVHDTSEYQNGSKVSLVIRPENIRPANPEDSVSNILSAVIKNVIYLGSRIRFDLDVGEGELFEMDLTPELGEKYKKGDKINIACDPDRLRIVTL